MSPVAATYTCLIYLPANDFPGNRPVYTNMPAFIELLCYRIRRLLLTPLQCAYMDLLWRAMEDATAVD